MSRPTPVIWSVVLPIHALPLPMPLPAPSPPATAVGAQREGRHLVGDRHVLAQVDVPTPRYRGERARAASDRDAPARRPETRRCCRVACRGSRPHVDAPALDRGSHVRVQLHHQQTAAAPVGNARSRRRGRAETLRRVAAACRRLQRERTHQRAEWRDLGRVALVRRAEGADGVVRHVVQAHLAVGGDRIVYVHEGGFDLDRMRAVHVAREARTHAIGEGDVAERHAHAPADLLLVHVLLLWCLEGLLRRR
jgi:hypothetical protein